MRRKTEREKEAYIMWDYTLVKLVKFMEIKNEISVFFSVTEILFLISANFHTQNFIQISYTRSKNSVH